MNRKVIYLALIVVMGMVWTGCSSTVKERRGEPPKGETSVSEVTKSKGKYYHFNDVLVPEELKYKQNKSFVYETPRFKAGVLVFTKWWLDVDSLIDFFTYHMEKDNWKIVNSFRGRDSILNFSKPDRTATIKILEKWYGTTEVQIQVGPLGEKKM
jgi:hypothetical protein